MTGPLRPQPGRPGVYRHPALSCRACGATHNALTNADRGGPPANDGDFTVCFRCGVVAVLVIGPLGVAMRAPSPEELLEFAQDHPHVVDARTTYL